jgi:PAS domain S-box-containing protein
MHKSAKWLASAFEQLDVPVLVVGVDRLIAYANPAAQRLFGAAPGALEGQGLERLVVPERRGELRNVEDVLAGGGARRVRSVLRRDDGSRLDVTMTVEPSLDESGRVDGATVRYEAMASTGRMSASPGGRISLGPPLRTSSAAPSPRISSLPSAGGGRVAPPASGSFSTEAPPLPGSQNPGILPPSSGVIPPGRRSEQRLMRTPSELELRLHRVERNLEWLEERLGQPGSVAPLDDPRERARALLVVAEARAQVRHSLTELTEPEARESEPLFPAPPKLPKL